ncbi:mechanosensitive ion channel domain-containing protein [Caulobacter sp. BE264]|uniref:mechanosensitive ion channel family protein n=1 Tax=Caulobacter sp. BE264 TaxID=2817724 RepID=UPI00286A1748|nr:mechanosensitive ion channel domain-containing protein [Caulobacter sp. BE264]
MDAFSTALSSFVTGFAWAPPWLVSFCVIALALFAALATHALAVRLVRRTLSRRDAFWQALIARTRRPTRMALIVAALGPAVSAAPLSAGQADAGRHVLLVLFILLIGWIAMTALDIGAALYLRGFKVDVEDNLLARKHVTQVRILRRAMAILVGLFTLALALMTVPGVKQWGVSLLAAGGAASLIVGLALQPLLTNLIAGIQIAVTQPIRIDDAVIVEKEWGNIEEITATYVVVRLWDWRRLVLPLTYFIQTPFQNWTRENAALIGTAMLYVDPAAPVDRLRTKLEEIARASPLWDGKVVNLAVTDIRPDVMEIRCLVSARNAPTTFDLRCEVREKMMAFLRDELPEAFPRSRLALAADPARSVFTERPS